MLVLCNLIILYIFGLFEIINKKRNKIFEIITMLILLITISYKDFNLPDNEAYYLTFKNINNLATTHMEKGILIYFYLIKNYLIDNYNFSIFILNIFLLSIMIIKTKKNCKNYLIFPLFFNYCYYGYYYSMVIIRNWIVVCIFLISLGYLNSSKFKYLIINIVGTIFHKSALLYTPVIIFNKKLKIKLYTFILLLIIVVYKLKVIKKFSNIIIFYLNKNSYLSSFGEKLNNRLLVLDNNEVSLMFILNILTLITFLYFLKKDKIKEILFLNLFILGILIYSLGNGIPGISRVSDMYLYFEYLVVSDIILNYNKVSDRIKIYIFYSIIYFFKFIALIRFIPELIN